MEFKQIQKIVHENAISKGWYDGDGPTFAETIANCHAELSEAWESHRMGCGVDEVFYPEDDMKPEGIPIELADVVIRIMVFCEAEGIDLELAIQTKHAYNLTRAYRHGGKVV